jgi:hypothetical protein
MAVFFTFAFLLLAFAFPCGARARNGLEFDLALRQGETVLYGSPFAPFVV